MSMDPEFAAAFQEMQAQMAAAHQANPPDPNRPPSASETLRALIKGLTPGFEAALKEDLPAESSYTAEDRTIPVEGGEIRVRLVIPTSVYNKEKSYPVFVWFHGGGWVAGDINTDDYPLRILSVELQVVTVNVEYRLAPEHPFPIPLNDSLAAIKWTVANAASIRVDASKGLIIGGDSAGGNLAAVLAHLVRDDPFFKDHPLTGQVLREPLIIYPEVYPEEHKAELLAFEENANDAFAGKDLLLQCRASYNPPANDDPRFSPYFFPSHANLAPAFIQRNERDPLRDDARLASTFLREAGVKVRSVLYPGVPHGFYYATPPISIAQRVFRDTIEGVKWLLAGAP